MDHFFVKLALALCVFLSMASAANDQLQKEAPTDSKEEKFVTDVLLDVPDIVVEQRHLRSTVVLEAFRVKDKGRGAPRKWASFGYPVIVGALDGDIFQFMEEYVAVYIRRLDEKQKLALMRAAQEQYRNESVTVNSIIPMPLAQFACEMNFRHDNHSFTIRGSSNNFKKSPFLVKFMLAKGSKEREAFEQRRRHLHREPLFLDCTLIAAGQQEKRNILKITAEQLQEIKAQDKLLGPANSTVVVRSQMKALAQEVESKLNIEEQYEIDGEQFSEEFIEKILNRVQFEPMDYAKALKALSNYGAQMDKRDTMADKIQRELNNSLRIEKEGGKSFIKAARDVSDEGSNKDKLDRARRPIRKLDQTDRQTPVDHTTHAYMQ